MVDCVGKELNIGDKVICADSRYADLLIGEVVKLTPQKVLVRYHRSEYGKEYTHEKLKEPYQIFKYVEVVRCKDCKHTRKKSAQEQFMYNENVCICTKEDIWGITKNEPVWDDWFCSCGERKNNDNGTEL